MYDRIGLKVRDISAAVHFYSAALKPLGHVLCEHDVEAAGFSPPGEPAPWLSLKQGEGCGGVHLAFYAASREAVDRFHSAAMQAGGRDRGRPGERASAYAAYLADPDGNTVEAVCRD
jgi:catechol 2,3-dioxygenase-like lactoylglutathione lyase family enzyme